MEITDMNNTNIEIKPKKLCSEAQKRASKAYYARKKEDEEYKQKMRQNSKRVYENDKERIIARVRANQRRIQELEQLARLNELKEQGLITFEKFTMKDNQELLSNLEILGM